MGLSCHMYLLLSLLALQVWGKKDKPTIEATPFDVQPVGLHYFPDSNVIFLTDPKKMVTYRSEDAGVKWEPLDGPKAGDVLELVYHPYDNKVAVFLGQKKKHWITRDQGKTWAEFKCEASPTLRGLAIKFHATDPDRILFLSEECKDWDCEAKAYYTTDGFKSDPKLLREDVATCLWAKSTDIFTTGDKDLDLDQILCIVKPDSSSFKSEFELRISDDYFKTKGTEPSMGNAGTVSGMISLTSVKGYLVTAAKSEGTTEMAMFVSDDSKTWHRAEFGDHKLEEDSYTLLESTNYSMQVDVQTSKGTPMGVLLTSNSNGTFFRTDIEHTNRNIAGFVDFEKIQNIQGILLLNVVDNWEDVSRKWLAPKKIKSKISFEDGRKGSWKPLKVKDDELQLHSVVTANANMGAIFSSPAPGLVMGVGNTGKHLKNWKEGDTYVSDDAGLTWKKTLDEPHLYEFGAQGSILVAIEDAETDELKWSINHGKDWTKASLKELGLDDKKIRPLLLTTTPDATSLKFILQATQGKGSKTKYITYSIDFDGLHERKCKDSDFEDWWTRVDGDGKPTCIMGHTQKFRRRKADADCFVDDEFKDPVPVTADCKCDDTDFECDHENGFSWDEKDEKCLQKGSIKIPDGECKGGKEKFMGTSGYKLVPGNTCDLKNGKDLTKAVERECSKVDNGEKPSGKISVEITNEFGGSKFDEYYYLERTETSHGDDETVIMRTDRRQVFISHDHGKTWEPIEMVGDDEIVAIYPHQYVNDAVYLITPSKKVYYSHNRGKDWDSFDAPEGPNQLGLQILQFHPDPKNRDWLIWTGSPKGKNDGSAVAHVTQKGGDGWETLLKGVRKCQFVYGEKRAESDQLVFCEQFENEDTAQPLALVSSDDFFKHKKDLKRDVVQFATMAEYIVVAMRDEDQKNLRVDTSIDGQTFADAQFPHNFQVSHQQAYTVLDSATHAVFLHVTVNGCPRSRVRQHHQVQLERNVIRSVSR